MNPDKGLLLISQPTLNEDIFSRTVILLTDYNENGSVGFILNKPADEVVNNKVKKYTFGNKMFIGGPVEQEKIFYIHNRPDLIRSSIRIAENLFWSGNFEDIQYNFRNGLIKSSEIRFFMGYSGWSEGQLEDELKNKMWILNKGEKMNFFENLNSETWKNLMLSLGGENVIWANSPSNLRLN